MSPVPPEKLHISKYKKANPLVSSKNPNNVKAGDKVRTRTGLQTWTVEVVDSVTAGLINEDGRRYTSYLAGLRVVEPAEPLIEVPLAQAPSLAVAQEPEKLAEIAVGDKVRITEDGDIWEVEKLDGLAAVLVSIVAPVQRRKLDRERLIKVEIVEPEETPVETPYNLYVPSNRKPIIRKGDYVFVTNGSIIWRVIGFDTHLATLFNPITGGTRKAWNDKLNLATMEQIQHMQLSNLDALRKNAAAAERARIERILSRASATKVEDGQFWIDMGDGYSVSLQVWLRNGARDPRASR